MGEGVIAAGIPATSSIEEVLPLSPLQEGLLFHAILDEDDPDAVDVYIAQLVVDLEGPLDRRRLRAALDALVRRHAVLRTAFIRDLGEPVQVVLHEVEVPWTEVELGAGTGAEIEARRLLEADRRTRFDLGNPPPVRALLLGFGSDRHRLVLTNHHIVIDGWSTPLLIRDLFALYAGSPLPPVRPYRDHLAWLRRQDQASSLAAWTEALAGVDGPTLLVPAARGTAPPLPDEVVDVVPAELTATLTALARRCGATLNTLIQAGWAILLGRLTGRDDVVFGATVSGRPADLPGVESMVGLFINTVPVRVRLPPVEPVTELLARLQVEQAALLDHQHVGLAEIQHVLGTGELFDSLLVFESFPFGAGAIVDAERVAGLHSTAMRRPIATHYPVTLMVMPGDGTLELTLKYRPGAVDGAALLARFTRVLAALVTEPSVPPSTIDIRSAAERQRQAARNTPAPATPETTLPELFATQAARTPHAVAVECGDSTLTYQQLDALANRHAHRLAEHGVGPEDRVAVLMDRSVDLVVALLGVLKAGAAYLPIDPTYPAGRIGRTLTDAAPAAVVTDPGTALPAAGIPQLVLDGGESRTAPAPQCPPHPDHPAYVIYTSGSTGAPKGVVVPHRAVTALLGAARPLLGYGGDDVWTLFHSTAFDFSVWELWGPLLSGGRLVVVPRELTRAPAELLDLMVGRGVTVLNQTPSAFAELARADAERPGLLSTLRTVVLGGEALEPTRLAGWFSRNGHVQLVNMYGITETTVHVTHRVLELADAAAPECIIGLGLPGLDLHLLDSALRPVPDGVIGELYVGGAQLARGYLGRAGLTATRFIAHPSEAGERLYRSGDLARWTPSGELEHVGRADDQVKIRGFRIEPAEVAATMLEHTEVTDCAVVAHSGPTGPYLAAYLVGTADHAALRVHATQRLPAHLVPTALVTLDALPLTGNGKLDRRALPIPDLGAAADSREPATVIERVLAQLFAEVLGCERVGVHDSFFDLGGHSLLATRLVARIRSELELEVYVRTVFDHPTVAGLAGLAPAARERPALIPVQRPDRLPLSPAQQRLWFLHRFTGPGATYLIPFALAITGPLDVPALRAALGDVVTRHESLRTVFPSDTDGPYQQVLDPATPDLPVVEASDPAAVLPADAAAGFELEHEPPIRFRLLRTGPEQHALSIVVHHIAGDEWSMRVLVDDLAAAYAARRAGNPPAWAPLPVQYADYTLWQRDLLGDAGDPGSLGSRQLAYWHGALESLPEELVLPADRPRPRTAGYQGGTVRGTVPEAVHAGLRALGRELGASDFMVVEAAVAITLAKLGAGTDIPLGVPVAGRTDDAMVNLVGFFINTLVLRNDLSGDPLLREVVTRARDTLLAGYAHQDLPFERLVEALDPERALARHPLFQATVALQDWTDAAPDLAGTRTRLVLPGRDIARFDLAFRFGVAADQPGLRVEIRYGTALFDPATAQSFLDRLLRVLAAVAMAPDTPLSRLDVLSAAERHQLLHGFNDTGSPATPAVPTTLLDLIGEQFRRTPDAVAVVCGGSELTFAQLDQRATALAHRLARLGAGPDRAAPGGELVVGMHLDRSIDLVVALLAVCKAGAAFVPVEPAWPAQRIAEVCASSGLHMLITSGSGRSQLSPVEVPVIEVDAADHLVRAAGGDDVGGAASHPRYPENLAYVIYTSGTTGRSKGAMIRHGAIAARLLWQAELLELGPGDAVLFKAPLGFDISINEIFLPLVTGARLVIAEPGEERDAARLLELVRIHRVTFVYLVSSVLDVMLQLPAIDAVAGTLRHVWCGGEVLSPELFERFRGKLDAVMYHGYGPAETTIGVTHQVYGAGMDRRSVSIGRPNPTSRIRVLDAALNPVPVGVQGELYVGGPPLGRGYVNAPGQTASRFVADPWTPGERLYRTGDLGCWTPAGTLEFRGREDHQVKVRGMRVELQEIEAVLAEHRAVRQAVVIATDQHLAAYCTTSRATDGAALRDWLGNRLPEHMVPLSVTCLEEFPLMASGKVDRRALPTPEPLRAGTGREAADDTEAAVCALFSEVLERDQTGPDDSFFELGGTSLLATRLVARILAELGTEIPVSAVFDTPTPAGLARAARGDVPPSGPGASAAFAPLQHIRRSGSRTPLFCVHPRLGLSWMYASLLPHLDRDRPVFGLQATAIEPASRAAPSIPYLAEHYAQLIVQAWPQDPYLLLGWSLGGRIAHSVACLLQSSGHRVPLLILLDSQLEREAPDTEPAVHSDRDRSLLYYRWLERAGYDVGHLEPARVSAATVARTAAEVGGVFAGLTENAITELVDSLLSITRVDKRAAPGIFVGDVLYFSARDSDGSGIARWRPHVCGQILDRPVDFDHDDLMTSRSLAQVGPIVAEYLARS